jgi:hypothetical protein
MNSRLSSVSLSRLRSTCRPPLSSPLTFSRGRLKYLCAAQVTAPAPVERRAADATFTASDASGANRDTTMLPSISFIRRRAARGFQLTWLSHEEVIRQKPTMTPTRKIHTLWRTPWRSAQSSSRTVRFIGVATTSRGSPSRVVTFSKQFKDRLRSCLPLVLTGDFRRSEVMRSGAGRSLEASLPISPPSSPICHWPMSQRTLATASSSFDFDRRRRSAGAMVVT